MAASESLKALKALLNEESESEKSIGALRDTDYRDKDAFFKMVQLLKGLATTVDEDETAKKFMSAVSDALTTAAKKVLGENVDEEYKFPRKKKDLAPKTPANLKKRATLFKSATDKVDGALKDIAKIPPVDFMGDIPYFEKALKDILDGDGGEGGMRSMAKEYAREKGGK